MTRRIYFLGPEGTFSSMAVSRFPHGADLARTFVRTIPEVFARTTAEPDAMGVVPIENLSTGNIGLTLDCLQLYGDAEITAELKLEIRFALVYKGEISCIERLYSHTEAYNQCSGYIFRNLKNHNLLEAPSNIAAYYRYTEDLKPETAAAIIPLPFYESENIAVSYTGITDIQNERDNFTRFIIIRKSGNAEPDFTRYKTSIFVDMFQDRPSLLYHILEKFHRNGINMDSLHSKPSKKYRGNYSFFIDFKNHRPEAVSACLRGLKEIDVEYRILGTYDSL